MFRLTVVPHRLLIMLVCTKHRAFFNTRASAAPTIFPVNDTVSQIIDHFNSTTSPRGNSSFLLDSLTNKTWFISEIHRLTPSEIGTIIETVDPQNAICFFFVLQNAFGICHTRNSKLLVAHLLAGKQRSRALWCHLQQVLEEEGSGSARLFCDLLRESFNGWASSPTVWDMLAFVYLNIGLAHDALVILSNMKDLNMKPSIMTYNSLLHNLRHTDIMWDIYDKIEATCPFLTDYTNSIFVDGLCRQLLITEAVVFLRQIEERGVEPCVVLLNTLMSGLCRMGFVDIAKSLFVKIFKYGLEPDAYSYNIMIHGLCVTGSLSEALDFTKDMQKNNGLEPDEVTYNILAKGFRHRILQNEMRCKGLKVDPISYWVLFSSLCKTGQIQRALGLLSELEDVDMKLDLFMYIDLYKEMHVKSIISKSTFHGFKLIGLCKKRTVSEARSYLNNLTESDLVHDVHLYNMMIDRYIKLGNMEQALESYKKLLHKGLAPTVVTFNSLINGSCKARNLADACRWFRAIKMHNLTPSIVTYTTLMNAFCEAGDPDAAFKLLDKMKANGLELNRFTYTVIMKGLCMQGRLEQSLKVLEVMSAKGVSPDQVSYNVLIQWLCRARDLERACKLVDDMVLLKIQPSSATYEILINGLCVYGELRGAESIFYSLQEQNVRLSKVVYMTLLKAICAKGDVRKVHVLFRKIVEDGFEVSVKDYSAVINRLCRRFFLSDAVDFFRMMLVDGVVPDKKICSTILSSLDGAGKFICKFQFHVFMLKCGFDLD